MNTIKDSVSENFLSQCRRVAQKGLELDNRVRYKLSQIMNHPNQGEDDPSLSEEYPTYFTQAYAALNSIDESLNAIGGYMDRLCFPEPPMDLNEISVKKSAKS